MIRRKIYLLAALAFFLNVLLTHGAEAVPIKVACVGDSITFGAGIEDRAKNSYPAQLGAKLGDGYEVKNFGVSGATLLKNGNKPYWKLKQFVAAQKFQPNIVIIKLGTNDTKPGNWKHAAEFVPNYVELVQTFQSLESAPTVWICYPVPVFAQRWGINEENLKEVIPLLDKVSKETSAKIIDLYKSLEGKPELVPDKVHPNAAGAKLMTEEIFEVIFSDLSAKVK